MARHRAGAAAENPGLINLDSDYYERKPQLGCSIDRNRAADLGVSLDSGRAHARNHDGLAHRHDVIWSAARSTT